MKSNSTENSVQENAITEQAELLGNLLPDVIRRLFLVAQTSTSTDLPITQLRVCLLLQAERRTMSAISDEMGVTMSAVTQIADRLEQARMVERISKPEDRRVKLLQLTPFGQEVMQARVQSRVRRLTDVLNVLPPDVRVTLLKNLQLLLEACHTITPDLQNSIAEVMRLLV